MHPGAPSHRSAHVLPVTSTRATGSDKRVARASAADVAEFARSIRCDVLRMTSAGRSSHVGSCLSSADIVATLFRRVLRHDPSSPVDADRDRLILSKGHAGAILYAALAEAGYFPRRVLESHYQNGSVLSGHVSHRNVPGVEVSTGSLGHGLSIGVGLALESKRRELGFRTYVVLSDGECDEGSVWEAAMFAAHHRLSQLVAIVDYNKLQSLGPVSETIGLEPFAEKWRAFGWECFEVDGHDHVALIESLEQQSGERPRCLLAHTVKGKGVSFMENRVEWHYKHANPEELALALAELNECKAPDSQ